MENMGRSARHIVSRVMAAALAASVCLTLSVSCRKGNIEPPTMPDEIDNVLLIYMAGKANGLAGDMRKNIEDFCDGYVPEGFSRNILLTYEELTGSTGPTRSYLVRIYRHNGKTVRDTVVTYPVTSIGASRETLEDVLNETRRRFPGKGYGLLISSHGTGWLPKGYYRTSGNRDMTSSDGRRLAGRQYDSPGWVPYEERWQDPSLPAVKSICQDVVLSDGMTVSYEMNINEFAEAIPYHLDYIIMDCCFMGGVEIAYELKDVCDRIIFSPAEVLSLGFNYNTMGEHLLADDSPDLEGVARDYYEKYEAMSGTYQSATVTLVDCSGLATLAETCRQIFSSHGDQMEQLDGSGIQRYFRYNDSWFYDLKDIIANSGADETELDLLDAAIDDCIIYRAATERFISIDIERYSGFSMYLPSRGTAYLDSFYSDLAWNRATGLVQ